jgi:hypothetical protein
MKLDKPRPTTPEEEGIELYPDAMERLARAVKAAARHGPIPAGTIKGKRVTAPKTRRSAKVR